MPLQVASLSQHATLTGSALQGCTHHPLAAAAPLLRTLLARSSTQWTATRVHAAPELQPVTLVPPPQLPQPPDASELPVLERRSTRRRRRTAHGHIRGVRPPQLTQSATSDVDVLADFLRAADSTASTADPSTLAAPPLPLQPSSSSRSRRRDVITSAGLVDQGTHSTHAAVETSAAAAVTCSSTSTRLYLHPLPALSVGQRLFAAFSHDGWHWRLVPFSAVRTDGGSRMLLASVPAARTPHPSGSRAAISASHSMSEVQVHIVAVPTHMCRGAGRSPPAWSRPGAAGVNSNIFILRFYYDNFARVIDVAKFIMYVKVCVWWGGDNTLFTRTTEGVRSELRPQ